MSTAVFLTYVILSVIYCSLCVTNINYKLDYYIQIALYYLYEYTSGIPLYGCAFMHVHCLHNNAFKNNVTPALKSNEM